jgi:hypothetical protein
LERENEMAEVSIDDRINGVLEAAKADEVNVGIHFSVHAHRGDTDAEVSYHVIVTVADGEPEGIVDQDPVRAYIEALRRLRYQQEGKA